MRIAFFLFMISLTMIQCTSKPVEEKTPELLNMWIGTYTKKEGHVDGQAPGIFRSKVDAQSGDLKDQFAKSGIINPSFVAVSPDDQYLYAVSETGPDVDTTGYVYAYMITDDSLKMINRQPSYAFAPCHVSVHPSGKWVFVANYVGGVIAMYPVQETGALAMATDIQRFSGSGPNTARQEASHPHSVFMDPKGNFLLTPDLGTDKIMIFRIDTEAGKLIPADPPFAEAEPGSGPRHLVFYPDGKSFYVIHELNNTIVHYRFDPATGAATREQTISTLPSDFTGTSYCADIHLTPDARFLYGSNRGHNSIAIFSVDPLNQSLKAVGHQYTKGDFPRNFTIDPEGKRLYVANQNSSNIVQFNIDPETGMLEETAQYRVPTPVCLVFQ
ncbi:MAG: lactonase family protein [Lewinellaceae bacterium]|nr:lactonase family protein [Lewinella sp.]MCB9280007.1 lactonase family protein [Lewinellaceae bacterium]